MATRVAFVDATVGPAAEAAVAALEPGGILLLENTRFDPREKADDPAFSAALAEFGQLYVNDAFGTAHRAHASTHGVARAIRARGGLAVAGYLLEEELRYLGEALDDPERPFVAILGGAKISGKIDVIEALLPRVDRLLVGGAMANTFFLALGLETGDSLVEPERVEMAGELLERAGERILLPVDVRVAPVLSEDAEPRVAPRDGVVAGERIADIGPESEALFADEAVRARTVVWNGPMGIFEMAPFASGTVAVARAVARAADEGAVTVVGGGDSVAAVHRAGVSDRITHISTGGGASLELLSGNSLPGVDALSDTEEDT
jgi:phosphoglycerate kinase